MSARGIGALERGDRRTPQRDTLALLSDALELEGDARREFEAAAKSPGSRRPKTSSGRPGVGAERQRGLPLALTSFVGREAEVAALSTAIRKKRFVTIAGPGGVGKTRTALEAAGLAADAFADGVCLVELARVDDPSRVVALAAEALGVVEAPNRSLLDTLLAQLEAKQLLILLDNCEHVIEAARSLANTLLRTCPTLHVLATSREPLNVFGEHVHRLAPLPVPDAERTASAREVLECEAALLFSDRAAAVNATFELHDDDAPFVARICRALDGLPLAIELAAVRTKLFSTRELAQRIDERLELLTAGDATAEARHRSLSALIAWSYDLLPETERRLLRELSVFPGDFSMESVTAVHGRLHGGENPFELVASLVDKSLVQAEPGEGATRYRLLESIRLFARARLDESGEDAAATRAHAVAFLDSARASDAAYAVEPDDAWKARCIPLMDDWRAALEWSIGRGNDLELGALLHFALRWTWAAVAPNEGRVWTEAALGALGPDARGQLAARMYLVDSQSRAWLSQVQASCDAADLALTEFERAGDVRGAAEARWRKGGATIVLGRPEGRAMLADALEVFRTLALEKLAAWTLLTLAVADAYADDLTSANALGAEVLALARERGFANVATTALNLLAESAFRSGDAKAAIDYARDALDGGTPAQSPYDRASITCNLAAYLLETALVGEARERAREAIALAREARVEYLTLVAMQHLAGSYFVAPDAPEREAESRAEAARLLGYVDSRFAALGARREFNEERQYDALIRPALARSFGEGDSERLLCEGRAWNEGRAAAAISAI